MLLATSLSDQRLSSNPHWEPTVLRDARFDIFQRRVKTIPCSWGLLGNRRFLVRRKLLGDLIKISSFVGLFGESDSGGPRWKPALLHPQWHGLTTVWLHCSGSADSSGPFGRLTTQGHTRVLATYSYLEKVLFSSANFEFSFLPFIPGEHELYFIRKMTQQWLTLSLPPTSLFLN